MRHALLCPLGTLGLLACSAAPVATAAPIRPLYGRLTSMDSLGYRVTLQKPAYYAVFVVTPGQPTQRLGRDTLAGTHLLDAGTNFVTIPALPAQLRAPGDDPVPRIGTRDGYLDELGTSVRSPATLRVYWESHPGPTTGPPAPTLVLMLFPSPLSPGILDRPLADSVTSVSVATTVRGLALSLGLSPTPPWVVLDPGRPRSAI